jgi:hypothetical protein
MTIEQQLKAELSAARAEIALQTEMINGARKAAARLMCQNTEMRHALDRIRIRTASEGELRDQFELMQMIASEAVTECQKIEAMKELQ